MASKFAIKIHYTLVAHPQSNGQVEIVNQIIKNGIKKRLDKSKGRWPGELYHVLWSYWTTLKRTTGETHYSLVYGIEALLPVEVTCPTIWTEVFQPEANEEGLRGNLDYLDEKREIAELRRKAFQERVAKLTNSKVKPKDIKTGDLVLKQTKLGSRKPEGGVFGRNWEGRT